MVGALDTLIYVEQTDAGTLERSHTLRGEVIRAAFQTTRVLYVTDIPFGLMGALVTLCALLAAWWKNLAESKQWSTAGPIVFLLLVVFAGVMLIGSSVIYFQRRTWQQADKKLRYLSAQLRRRGGAADVLIAQALEDAAAGAPTTLGLA
jgi:hypothetical protein